MKYWLFRNKYLHLSTLIIVTICIYSPGIRGSFVFDDLPNIIENPALQIFDGSFSSLIDASLNGVASPLGRPLSMASFALNLHFNGGDPLYFKLVNLVIHLLNGVMIFVLAQRLCPRWTGGDKSSLAALWIAAVWLLHPLNLTPVLFVAQRMTSLAAFFTLAALLLYLYGRQTAGSKGWMAIALSLLLCWPMALMSKETGLLLPLYIVVCEWLVLRCSLSFSSRILWLGAISLGFSLAGIVFVEWNFVVGGYTFRDFGLVERLLTESRVLWFYLLQLLFPWPDLFSLHHDDFTISRGLLSPPQTVLAIVGWLVLIVFTVLRHQKYPLFAFAVTWFLVAHALESTILPLELAYEHRNYLASFGILIWLAGLLFTTQERGKVPRLVLAGSFLIFCGLVTTLRASLWGDEFRRTQLEAEIHPKSARTNYEAGTSLVDNTFLSTRGGNAIAYQTAQFYFKRAAELDKNSKAPLISMLYLDCLTSAPKNQSLQLSLRERFTTSPFTPGDQGMIKGLSQLLVENRLCLNDAEVDTLLNAGLSNPTADGKITGMINAVGMDYALAKIGSANLALKYARAAVASNPSSVPLGVNLVRVLLAAGDVDEARRVYRALTKLDISPVDRTNVEQLGVIVQNRQIK